MNIKALTAEFIGTFALIFIGAGAGALGTGGLVGVAFAHGLVVLGMAYAFGAISGCHINPAVTVGLFLAKQLETAEAFFYIAAQCLGGIAGAAALCFIMGGNESGLGATVLAEGVSPVQGVVLEALLTFFLVNAVLQTAVRDGGSSHAPFAIGLTLVFCILMGGPLTGASLNPARTLGPAIISGNFANHWLYWVGPIAGGAAAAGLFGFLGSRR